MLLRYFDWRNSISTPESTRRLLDSSGVGAALVDGDLFGHAVQVNGALDESFRRREVSVCAEQTVDGVAGSIDGSVQVLALAGDLDVRLVHAPAQAHRPLVAAKHVGQDRQHLDCPAMNRRVVDNTPLGHHLFDVAQARRTGRVPANAHQHHLQRVVHPRDQLAQRLDHCHHLFVRLRSAYPDSLTATEPAELVTTEMVAFEWARTCEHPLFRDLLWLMK